MNQLMKDTATFTEDFAGLLHLSAEPEELEKAAKAYHRAASISPRIERVTTALELYRAALESENVKSHLILLMLVVDRLFSTGLRGKVLVRGLREKMSSLLGEPVPEWVTKDYRSRNMILYGTSRDSDMDERPLRDLVCPRWRSIVRKLLRHILIQDRVRLFLNTSSLKKI